MIERDSLQWLVEEELARIRDPARRAALHSILIEPRMEVREWDYGDEGERFPYWIVAEEPAKGIILVYCEHGFGPESPWGFLFTCEPELDTLGMDSHWAAHLGEAFLHAGL